MTKFIRQKILAGVSLLKASYLGPLEDDFTKT